MPTVSEDFPRCGTCKYWCGMKSYFNNLVEYDSYEDARCGNRQSPAYGNTVSAEHYCFFHN